MNYDTIATRTIWVTTFAALYVSSLAAVISAI